MGQVRERLLWHDRVRPPVGAVLEVRSVRDLLDVGAVGVRGVDVLLAVDAHAEDDLRPVRRPVGLEGEALALEMDQAEAAAVGADGEQVALRGLRDDLLPVGRPLGRSDLVRVCEAVGRDLPKAGSVDVLNEQPDLICAVVRSRWPWAIR